MTYVYRVYDADNRLLYVGMSDNVEQRLGLALILVHGHRGLGARP